MNKLITIFMGSAALIAALPALAGPDWQIIEQARKAKQTAAQQEQPAGRMSTSGTAGAPASCRAQLVALGLDHGPRATTTPWLNEQRKARNEAALRECPAQNR